MERPFVDNRRKTFLSGTSLIVKLNWQVWSTRAFNGNCNGCILWVFNGPNASNVVLCVDGAGWIGGGDLISVAELNWQIASAGNYNSDESIDILRRDYGIGGFV